MIAKSEISLGLYHLLFGDRVNDAGEISGSKLLKAYDLGLKA